MKRMKLSELTGNEILAQSLMTWDYQIILPEGAVLKKEYIDKIEEMGILEVYVKEDEANEIVILKNDIEKIWTNKRIYVIPHKTYHRQFFLMKGDNDFAMNVPDKAKLLY